MSKGRYSPQLPPPRPVGGGTPAEEGLLPPDTLPSNSWLDQIVRKKGPHTNNAGIIVHKPTDA